MTVNQGNNYYLPPAITVPSSLTITAITNSNPMVVTISVQPFNESNTYIAGMAVILRIPVTYMMQQANKLVATILSVSGNNLTLNIDSTLFDPFVVPGPNVEQPATLAPNGSRNLQYDNTNYKIVPFQNLNPYQGN